jgi:Protein of unknown function (DUF559)
VHFSAIRPKNALSLFECQGYALTMNEPVMLGRARRMRKDATDADRKVWSLVRNRRLDGYRLSAPSSNRRLLLLPI